MRLPALAGPSRLPPLEGKPVARNARFWVWENGAPVKLTLRPGQSLAWASGGPTDEGWHRDETRWFYPADEPFVYRAWCSDGADCDGRLTRAGEDRCYLPALRHPHHTDPDDPSICYPRWEELSASQRDQFAEMMGY